MTARLILANAEIVCGARVINLSPQEALLLGTFWKRHAALPDDPYAPAQEIASWLWGTPDRWPAGWHDDVKIYISNIRGKTHDCGFTIINKREIGYRFAGELEVVGEMELPA